MSTPDLGTDRLTDEAIARFVSRHPHTIAADLAREVQRLREMERNVRAVPRLRTGANFMPAVFIDPDDLDAALGDAKP